MVTEDKTLASFKEICRRICLNIPAACRWEWDEKRGTALIVLENPDAELVYFPLLREFRDRWNFTTGQPDTAAARLLDSEYGLLPGQTFFASPPVENLVLFVAWWPWGRPQTVSMRVGILPLDAERPPGFAFTLLSRWLPLNGRVP